MMMKEEIREKEVEISESKDKEAEELNEELNRLKNGLRKMEEEFL